MLSYFKRHNLYEWIHAFVWSVVMVILIFLLFWPLKIQGSSMETSFFSGDRIVVSRVLAYYNILDYGDVVVCNMPIDFIDRKPSKIIKRIIALPGDHLLIKGGSVYINGIKLHESYINEQYTYGNVDVYLGQNEFFVMGDNRDVSLDSRSMGPIDKGDILAKVILKLHPLEFIN